VPTTSSLAFVNPWFNPINPAAYHPVTVEERKEVVSKENNSLVFGACELHSVAIERF
jgi:hypothetical protein